jgi:hypothetical protein
VPILGCNLIRSLHYASLVCNFLDSYVLQISPFQDETVLSNPYNDGPVCLVVVLVQDGMPTHCLGLNPRHRITMNGHISSHLYQINFIEIPHIAATPPQLHPPIHQPKKSNASLEKGKELGREVHPVIILQERSTTCSSYPHPNSSLFSKWQLIASGRYQNSWG